MQQKARKSTFVWYLQYLEVIVNFEVVLSNPYSVQIGFNLLPHPRDPNKLR